MYKKVRNFAGILAFVISCSACGGELNADKNTILERDSRNESVDFTLRAKGKVLEYCVRNLSGEASSMDVFRVFLQIADHFKNRQFEKVNLCFRNETRFVLDGGDFSVIGKEYEMQNPMYTIRTFPEKLAFPNGQLAYEIRKGGVLYLLKVQMEDFQDMNGAWYLNELVAEQEAKTDALRPKEFASDDDVF